MEREPTPREMAKGLLNGVLPPRPLCLPIVFSLGAKVENVALDAFRTNPTRITSALRQMRAPLRADGVTCYFDPYLEVEALGAVLRRADDGSYTVSWPGTPRAGELPGGLCSPEEGAARGRVPIACEVIRRMNAVANRDFLLMTGVTGPMTLAAAICGAGSKGEQNSQSVSDATKEFASAVVTQLSTAYLEAGADLILIDERVGSGFGAEDAEGWANLLAPAINVTRFYEALPITQFADTALVHGSWGLIQTIQRDCVVCVPLEAAAERQRAGHSETSEGARGIALPIDVLFSEASESPASFAPLQAQTAELNPAVITTAGDVPVEADMKRLTQLLSQVARAA